MGTSNFRSTFLQDKYPQIPSEKFQPQYWRHLAPSEVSYSSLSRKTEYGYYQTYRHYVTGEEIDKYSLVFPNKEQLQLYIESFIWRMHQDYLVNSVYFEENAKQLCTFQRKANIYIPHIPLRLDDVNDIPYPFDIALLKSTLLGFQKLYQHVGYFKIKEGQICIDSEGFVKVWINTDLSKNYADNGNFVHIQGTMSQSEMAKQILEIVLQNLDESSQPEPLSSFIYSKISEKSSNLNNRFSFKPVISFQEVLYSIEQYVEKHSTCVPQNFAAIIQLMQQGNHQRLLNRQSISFGNENDNTKAYSVRIEKKIDTSRSKQSNYKILNESGYSITKNEQQFQQRQKRRYSKESNQSFNRKNFTLKNNKSNKSSLKDILSMRFNSKQNLPKSCEQPTNENIAQSGGQPIDSEFQVPKLNFNQEKLHVEVFAPKGYTKDCTQKKETIFKICSSADKNLKKRTMCLTERNSSKNSCPSSGHSISIPVTTRVIGGIVNARPLMPNPNYTPYPQSIYNPKNQRATPSHSASSNLSFQKYQYVQTPLYYKKNIMMPQIVHTIPARMQTLLLNPSHGGKGRINRAFNNHVNKSANTQQRTVSIPTQVRNMRQCPSQVLEASEEKGSSNMDESNLRCSHVNQINVEDSKISKKQRKEEIISKQKQCKNEIKIQKIQQSYLDNPDQKSLVCQKALKKDSSDQKTVNLSDKGSRYSHPVTKEDNQKMNTKQSKNKIFYSRLLSQNGSDRIQESSASNSSSDKDNFKIGHSKKEKTQREIRQSARKQFMAQVNQISQAYKKSFASQQNKQGFEHMMESLLSNYYTNQAYVVPQTHYSQTSKIPKKIPGTFLFQNRTIKQVPSRINLDPEIMQDLKYYESMESL